MSNENENNVMSIFKKNPLVTGIVVVVVILIIVLIIKMSGSEEAFSQSSDKIVENYPQSTPMNVMYSDANGNLGTTTDLGLQNLTVASDTSIGGRLSITGIVKASSADVSGSAAVGGSVSANRLVIGGDLSAERAISVNKATGDWNTQIHNPTSGGHVYMAHGGKYGMHINANNKDMDTYALQCVGGDKQLMILNGKGNMDVAGSINTGGTLSAGSINTGGVLSAGNINTGGNLTLEGDNKWIFHTPDDGRKTMYVAPFKEDKSDWNWGASTEFSNNGDVSVKGSLKIGNIVLSDAGDGTLLVTGKGITLKDKDSDNKVTFLLDADTSRAHGTGQRMTIKNKYGGRVLDIYQEEVKDWKPSQPEPVTIFSRGAGNHSYLQVRQSGFYGTSDGGCGNYTRGNMGCNFMRALE